MAEARVASARLMAMSRSASAAATSASRLMRAMSGRPMLVMYSFLSRTSFKVKLTTSSPILLMSSAQVERMRSPTISGSLTICSTVSWPMMPRRWPSITRRIRPSRCCGRLGKELFGGGENGLFVILHFDLRDGFDGDRDALIGIEALLRSDVEGHQLQREIPAGLHHRKNNGASSRVNIGSADAVDDERFVWPGFAIHSGDDRHEHQEHHDQDPGPDDHVHWQPEHKDLPFSIGSQLAAYYFVSKKLKTSQIRPSVLRTRFRFRISR